MNTPTVNAEEKSQRAVWIAAGVRTPFSRVDGPLLHRDSLTLSVPVARAMAEQVKGRIDFGVWGPVILNLAYNNLARELAAMPSGCRAIVSICADGGQGTVALLENR